MKKFLVLMLLTSCSHSTGIRDASAPFSSIAAFDATRFAGQWFEVAHFPRQEDCRSFQYAFEAMSPGALGAERRCGATVETGSAKVVGPGRLEQSFEAGVREEVWVLWVDADYRTAVMATRDGQAAWILDRSLQISEDRLNAAKEVLRFNGYDPIQLIRFAGEAA